MTQNKFAAEFIKKQIIVIFKIFSFNGLRLQGRPEAGEAFASYFKGQAWEEELAILPGATLCDLPPQNWSLIKRYCGFPVKKRRTNLRIWGSAKCLRPSATYPELRTQHGRISASCKQNEAQCSEVVVYAPSQWRIQLFYLFSLFFHVG